MEQKKRAGIDISLAGVKTKDSAPRAGVDIPLGGARRKPRRKADGINDAELEFVNRHHAQVKAARRRSR